jgi:oligopeptidase B
MITGTPQETDVMVFREEDKLFCAGVSKTPSEQFMVIESGSIETSEDRIIALEGVVGGPAHVAAVTNMRVVQSRIEGLRYSVDHHGSFFYIVTNKDNAKNSKLMRVRCDAAAIDGSRWEEVCAYDPAREVKYVIPFKRGVAVLGREGGCHRVWMVLGNGQGASDVAVNAPWNAIEFAEDMHSIRASGNCIYDTEVIRLKYSSLVTPQQTLEVNFCSGERTVLREKEVPGYDRSLYRTVRTMASSGHSPDVMIPISLVYHRDLLAAGQEVPANAPVLMNGYGSYGHSIDPSFDYSRLPLLNRGVVFAIAHIRGGGEMGRSR